MTFGTVEISEAAQIHRPLQLPHTSGNTQSGFSDSVALNSLSLGLFVGLAVNGCAAV